MAAMVLLVVVAAAGGGSAAVVPGGLGVGGGGVSARTPAIFLRWDVSHYCLGGEFRVFGLLVRWGGEGKLG